MSDDFFNSLLVDIRVVNFLKKDVSCNHFFRTLFAEIGKLNGFMG